MSRPSLLTEDEIAARLPSVPGFSVQGNKLTKTFVFADFGRAIAWVDAVAAEAERLDHHPTWTNTYRTVAVELSTHDAGGITTLDFDLAAAMNRLAP